MKTIKIEIKDLKKSKSKISFLMEQILKADIFWVREKNKVY